MKPFNLEEARKGAQIVNHHGRKAVDWHYFEGSRYPVFIQWENVGVGSYKEDDPTIGLAPDRVVEYLAFTENGFYSGCSSLDLVKDRYSDVIAYYKVSADEDGDNWSMERVE
jgi:hypothetical protein